MAIIKAANLLSAISIFLYTMSVSSRFEVKVIWDLLMCKLSGRHGGTHASSDYLLLKAVVYMAIVSDLVRSAHYLILEVFPHLEYVKWKATPSSGRLEYTLSLVFLVLQLRL